MRKTLGIGLEQEKFELKGWNNDADDNLGCKNLLQILESKITMPFISKTKPKSEHKLETLPAVIPIKKATVLQRELSKHDMDQQAEILCNQQVLCSYPLKKNKSQKIKINSIDFEQNTKSQIVASQHGKNKSPRDLKEKQKGCEKERKKKKDEDKKHKKLYSVPSLLTIQQNQSKSKKSILPKFCPQTNQIPAHLSTKTLRWDKFHSSKQKYESKLIIDRNKNHTISSNKLKMREGSLNLRKKNRLDQELELKATWFKKVFQKAKIKESILNIKHPKIVKTEICDFMDGHLQPLEQINQKQKL